VYLGFAEPLGQATQLLYVLAMLQITASVFISAKQQQYTLGCTDKHCHVLE